MNKELKIVCLGDSITWGFPFGPRHSWTHMLAEILQVKVINKGINGNTTTEMCKRFNRDVAAFSPSHVVIMGGANDIILADSFDRITWNYREMARKAQEYGITVIIGLPTPMDDEYYEKMLGRLRDWLLEFARKNQFKVIDFAAAFYNDQGRLRTELLLADGGHPASVGYLEMFKQIDIDSFT